MLFIQQSKIRFRSQQKKKTSVSTLPGVEASDYHAVMLRLHCANSSLPKPKPHRPHLFIFRSQALNVKLVIY